MADHLLKLLSDQFEKASQLEANIIAVEHMLPWRFLVDYKDTLEKDYMWAFYGCEGIGNLYDRYSDRISFVAFGHTHKKYDQLNQFGVRMIKSPVGYVMRKEDIKEDLGLSFVEV